MLGHNGYHLHRQRGEEGVSARDQEVVDGDAGVLERCANDFVEAAEGGDASVAILHSDVNAGCRVPILTALCKLAGILAWPHAVQTANADSTNATLTRAFELPIVRLLTIAPSTSSSAAIKSAKRGE